MAAPAAAPTLSSTTLGLFNYPKFQATPMGQPPNIARLNSLAKPFWKAAPSPGAPLSAPSHPESFVKSGAVVRVRPQLPLSGPCAGSASKAAALEGLTSEEKHAIQIATAAAAGAKAAAAARAAAAAKAQAMEAALEAEGLATADAGPAREDAELARALLGLPADAVLPLWEAGKVAPKEWETWDSWAKEFGGDDDEDLDGIHGSGADADMWSEMQGRGKAKLPAVVMANKAMAKSQAKSKGSAIFVGKGDKGMGKGKDEVRPPPKTGETWEQSRFETGLQLLGDLSPESAKWQYVLHDESRRSFAGYFPQPFSDDQCQDFFQQVKSGIDWMQPECPAGLVPRKVAWSTTKGCSCTYRYGSVMAEPQEFPPFMMKLLRVVMPMCGITSEQDWPDACNLNLYEDGGMFVGWHADSESLFQGSESDTRIISFSLGQRRQFELSPNWPEEHEVGKISTVMLGEGDLLVMEGMTQKHYKHRVPKDSQCSGARINLTWHWVKKHQRQCFISCL